MDANVLGFLYDYQRRGEIITAWARIGLCGFIIIMQTMLYFFDKSTQLEGVLAGFITCFIAISLSIFIIRRCKLGESFKYMRWISTTFDIFLVTLVMLTFIITRNSPEDVVTSVVSHIYYLLFILALIRQYGNVVLYTGILIAVIKIGFTIFAMDSGAFGYFAPIAQETPQIESVRIAASNSFAMAAIPIVMGIILFVYARFYERVLLNQAREKNKVKDIQLSFTEEMHKTSLAIEDTTNELNNNIIYASNNLDRLNQNIINVREHTENQMRAVSNTIDCMESLNKSINTINHSAEEQSSLVEQSSSAVREIAASTHSISNTSSQAYDTSSRLLEIARKGGMSVEKVIEAIQEMQEFSTQISDFVEVIRSISEQTNLLAMNAAIEAAHAGDSGKGFAVVAEEIRKLAENSAGSASEITGVIKEITTMISNTVNLSKEAGQGLNSIIEDTIQTAKGNQEVATAMQQQSKAIDEILKSMEFLTQISGKVKDLTREQLEISHMIEAAFDQLEKIAKDIDSSTYEQNENSKSLTQTLNNLKEIMNKNQLLISQLARVVEDFGIKEHDSKQNQPAYQLDSSTNLKELRV